MPSIAKLQKALEASWDEATAQDAVARRGHASGQCCVSSLVLLDYWPGELVRATVWDPDPIVHYYVYLRPFDTYYDATWDQFTADAVIRDVKHNPERHLYWFKDTETKYNILRDRVEQWMKNF